MASIFATALTFPSYATPTSITASLVALTGTLTVPDPGFAWTPIVMGSVAFYHDPTGSSTGTYDAVIAGVQVRMGSTSSGTLVATGTGESTNASSGSYGYRGAGIASVSQQYNAGANTPSYTGSQDIRAWIKRDRGPVAISTYSDGISLMVYILPTA